MRLWRTDRILAVGIFLATACSGGGNAVGPSGWSEVQSAGAKVWKNPKAPSESFEVSTMSTRASSLKDLASAVTIDAVLHYPGSKFVRSDPFDGCPGAAGIQHFILPKSQRVDIAFAYWDGKAVEAVYRGPAKAPVPEVITGAMTRTVCNTAI